MVHFYNNCLFQPIFNSSVNRYRAEIDNWFQIKTHEQSIATIIAGGRMKIQVGFQPKDDSLKTSLIIVR